MSAGPKAARGQRPADITSFQSWGCPPIFVVFVIVAGSAENTLRCKGFLPYGRPCLERVTGIEPAWSAWKA